MKWSLPFRAMKQVLPSDNPWESGVLPPSDALEPSPPLACSEQEIQRWNAEWFEYLKGEWQRQLTPYSAYPATPPLPDSPLDLLQLRLGYGPPLEVYCDRDALAGRKVMELGCGCGNLGKLLGRYVEHYLGTDYSTLALQIARLVSPPNCSYVQVADRGSLEPFFGRIDTAVGRYFWIHQNFQLAHLNLEYLELFLKPGGRVYADFYLPNPKREQGLVFTPDHALSKAYPSVTFRYSHEDVERLVEKHPFRIVRETVSPEMQRRFIVLEKQLG
jgi:SAM-dependent methyltransferase